MVTMSDTTASVTQYYHHTTSVTLTHLCTYHVLGYVVSVVADKYATVTTVRLPRNHVLIYAFTASLHVYLVAFGSA